MLRDGRVTEAEEFSRDPWCFLNTGLFFEIFRPNLMGVIYMPILRKCSFYRDPETLIMRPGIGSCDLDLNRTTCKGDVYFCKKYDVLRKHLLEQKHKEGNLGWGKR